MTAPEGPGGAPHHPAATTTIDPLGKGTTLNTLSAPRILHETSSGITATTIYDEMLARRELAVVGDIEQGMAFSLCQHIRRLEAENPAAPIAVFVSSPGGSVGAGLAVYDLLRSVSCPVRTVCTESAASMGSVIFMAGERREMYPHAELMVHDPLIPRGAGGSALSVQETSRRLMSTRRTLNTILAERSGLTLKRVQQLTGKESYLSAERAVELGFATGIIGSAKEKEN